MKGWSEARSIRRQRGFTLTELMVSVAIVAILVATSIPAYNTFLKQAKLLAAEIELITALKDFGVNADYHPASGMLADLVSEGYLEKIPNDPWSGISAGPVTGAEEAEDWYYANDGSQLYLYAKSHPGRLYTLASFGLPSLLAVEQTGTSSTSASSSSSSSQSQKKGKKSQSKNKKKSKSKKRN